MSIHTELIASTPNAARVVAAAARLCYSPSAASEILIGLDSAKVESFLKKLRESGHLSPFEHASYTFAVDGISRVATHQLVRHRLASYSQQSQRYVGMSGGSCVVPPDVSNNPAALEIFKRQADAAVECYNRLTEMGVPKEDARFILPHGFESRMVITMNARELHHFFELRLCRRAQWEIRELARQMFVLARKDSPELFSTGGPSCVAKGVCTEINPCGNPYKDMESMLKG